jgi:hypothetical protein
MRPDMELRRVDERTVVYGEGDEMLTIEVDRQNRGGIYITGAGSLHLHPATGTKLRVLTGAEDRRRTLEEVRSSRT